MKHAGDKSDAETYLELLDSATIGYCTLSRTGEFTEISNSLFNILGKEEDDLIGKQFSHFVSADTQEIFNRFVEKIFDGHSMELCEVGLIVNGEDPNFVRINGVISKNGKNCQILVLDCFACLNSKKFFQDSEEKYRHVFKAEKDSIFLIERETGSILDVNDAAILLYGYTREELLKLKHTDMSFEPFATKLATKELPDRVPLRYHKKKDGTVFPVDISASMFILNNREVILAAIRDITIQREAELKLAEQAVKLSEHIATKDKFFSIIAHDLRGPLGAFHNLSKILTEELSDMSQAKIREFAASMSKSSTTLYEMLENLLEWSRMQRGLSLFERSNLVLNNKIASFLQVLIDSASHKNIAIYYDIPEDLEIYADANMIESTFRNLVSNALKFTPKGGKITIEAIPTDHQSVIISIKDSGIGMTREIQDKLFRIDANISRPGTAGEASSGLGLVLCKEFVEMHGGKIWVTSEEGKGSSFFFELPNKA
jgi:PAS domain S-box-containing protein